MIAGLRYVDAFINKIAQTAQSVARKWKVPASVVIAQAALETNWGRALKGNAYFGVKQGATSGDAIAFTTSDFIDGQKVTIVDRFRKYKGLNDAANAYGQLLRAAPRYKEVFKYTTNPVKFAEALQQAGYATDPQYAQKLKSIINKYDLTAYDHMHKDMRWIA
jgi:flagellum-specific peptidoglycan hydrolase FlgJ